MIDDIHIPDRPPSEPSVHHPAAEVITSESYGLELPVDDTFEVPAANVKDPDVGPAGQ
jgi:hypothetical protein